MEDMDFCGRHGFSPEDMNFPEDVDFFLEDMDFPGRHGSFGRQRFSWKTQIFLEDLDTMKDLDTMEDSIYWKTWRLLEDMCHLEDIFSGRSGLSGRP